MVWQSSAAEGSKLATRLLMEPFRFHCLASIGTCEIGSFQTLLQVEINPNSLCRKRFPNNPYSLQKRGFTAMHNEQEGEKLQGARVWFASADGPHEHRVWGLR